MKKTQVMQVFSSRFKELWEEWDLRVVVFLSLTLQILLICMQNRRKYICLGPFWRFTWLAYDPVGIYAIGRITNRIMKINSQSVDTNTELNAFWAPFLLLHLGGPDNITAYALEDNELWSRHLFSLVTQAGVTFYIFLMAWTGAKISILTIVMILAGLVKYGERVYVLWAASSEQFRDSIPDQPSNYSKISEQHKLMEAEGYDVTPHEVIEICNEIVENTLDGADLSCSEESLDPEQLYKRKQGELLAARGLVTIFKRLFVDLLLSFDNRYASRLVLKDKNPCAAFKIIEIELGIMYDLLYTKAMASHTSWGITRRVIGLVSTCIVLVVFILIQDEQYLKVDLHLTFMLLAVAIFQEYHALAVLLFSDETACWLIKEKKFAVLDFINEVKPLTKRRRWSEYMAQYSLLSFAVKEKHLFCRGLLKFLHIDEKADKLLYMQHEEVTNDLKELIMSHFRGMQSLWTTRGSRGLEMYNKMESLNWSIELEFDQSLLIWHIATELCCHAEDPDHLENPGYNEDHINRKIRMRYKISKHLSRYMLYILAMYPVMLPTGIGRIKFQEIYVEFMKFFNEFKEFNELKSIKAGQGTDVWTPPSNNEEGIRGYRKYAMKFAGSCATAWQHIKKRKKLKWDVTSACNQLRKQVNTKLHLTVSKGDRSKYMLFHGCRLASQLDQIENEEKWQIISDVWVEMLCYAASKCKGRYHAQQLGRGGELLTHVWLMMAHFGLTDHFQIPRNPAVAELIKH